MGASAPQSSRYWRRQHTWAAGPGSAPPSQRPSAGAPLHLKGRAASGKPATRRLGVGCRPMT
eukprot:13677686-Alexandrium_andersonii.AAC.1